MNFFETEVVKYERRLANIKERPSHTMLRANVILYEAQLERSNAILKRWSEGKPFIEVLAMLQSLARACGDLQPLHLTRIADRLGSKSGQAAFDRVRALGFPDYACDRTILFMPLVGEEVPTPQIIVGATGACEIINETYKTLGHYLNVPTYMVDVPFEENYQDNLTYVTKQLEGLIEFIEANVPGAKYDEKKLIELQHIEKQYYNYLHDICQLRKHIPCPDHPRDVFREPLFPGAFPNPNTIVRYYEAYRDELAERIAKGFTPVGEEKLRVVWGITGLYNNKTWDFLAERGVSMPYWYVGQGARWFFLPTYGDTTEFGRKLTPLEEQARIILYNSWAGIGDRWISDGILSCKEFKADGLVLFEQVGCYPAMGVNQLFADHVKKELGIPTLRVQGRAIVESTEAAETELEAKLEPFINLCLQQRGESAK